MNQFSLCIFLVRNLQMSLRPFGSNSVYWLFLENGCILIWMCPLRCWLNLWGIFLSLLGAVLLIVARINFWVTAAGPMGVKPPRFYQGILIQSWFIIIFVLTYFRPLLLIQKERIVLFKSPETCFLRSCTHLFSSAAVLSLHILTLSYIIVSNSLFPSFVYFFFARPRFPSDAMPGRMKQHY